MTTTAMPSPDLTTALDIPDGVPLIVHLRVALDDADRPLTLEETRLPGDRAILVATPSGHIRGL